MLLYLGCTTDQRSIPFGYLLQLMVQGPLLFSGVFKTQNVDGRQGVRRYHKGGCTDTLEGLSERVPEICLFQ